MRAALRRALLALAVCCGGMAAWSGAAGGQDGASPAPAPDARLVVEGRTLFLDGCATCHGSDLRGRPGLGPSLRGAGAAAADFYLSTGRMPLANPTDEPVRTQPAYSRPQIDALVAFVGSFGGPGIPAVDPARGNLARGMAAFTEHCAGCHQVVARGGIVTGAAVPGLQEATPRQLAEAVRIGPYLMPNFGPGEIDQQQLDDIARYNGYAKHPDNRGGWAIGNIGPIPEGMIAWLLATVVLTGVARVIGERAP
jgi:ubiquinol-cytochrome c reductase cytochrome c subunit